MNYNELKVLLVDKQLDDAQNFLENLKPEFDFENVEIARSPHKAIQKFMEQDFDLCFVADLFTEEETQSFLIDLKGVDQSGVCVPIHLRIGVAANVKRDSYKQAGFPYIISRQGSELDKSGLTETIKKLIKDKEIQRRVLNIDDAMKVALREIDKLAESIKRSSSAKLDMKKFPMQFMELQTEFDEKVLEEYYNTLEKHTENAEANNVSHLYIPEDILAKRHFPGLSQDGYKGVSHRVWNRLKNKYGVANEEVESAPKPDPSLTSEELVKKRLANRDVTKPKEEENLVATSKSTDAEERIRKKMANMGIESD